MGSGIATCFLRAGYSVTLVDVNSSGLERGTKIVGRNIEQDVKRGRASQAKAEANIARLTPSTDLEALAGVDMVVEAVFENLDLKKKIFKVRMDKPRSQKSGLWASFP
jgi:3-hydroxyacyl-CoA dehydrogenase